MMTSLVAVVRMRSGSRQEQEGAALREAMGTRPVTVVVAAAGYGKTTAIRRWLDGRPASWYAGRAPAADADVSAAGVDVSAAGAHPFVIVDGAIDPADEPPAGARLVLISRTPLGAAVSLWRCRGIVTDIGPADLALDETGVAELLARHGVTTAVGTAAAGTAAALRDLTGGWPALVRLGAEAIGRRHVAPADLLETLAAPGTVVHQFIADEVCGDLPPAVRRFALDVADLEWATGELAHALNHRDGRRALRHLVGVGLAQPTADDASRYRVVPLVAAVLRGSRRRPPRRQVLTTAAHWYARQAQPAEAMRAAIAADDPATCAAILARHGRDLLAKGQPATVCWAVGSLPAQVLDDDIRLLHAEALHATGDTEASLATYQALDGGGPLPAGLAWRYGMARYLHGETRAALEVLRRGVPTVDTDGALLLAWAAAAYWVLGDAATCGEYATRAYRAAHALADGRALAAAHVALALHAQLTGDRPTIQAQYERALVAAESVQDGFSVVRIRTNRAASLVHEARYADALRMVEPAIALAMSAGYISLLAAALCNQGEALARLGRLDDAVAAYEHAATIYQRLRTEKLAYALVGLGDVYRRRRRMSQARAAYEEAVRVVSGGGHRQASVCALAGLARVMAETDPEQARALAERAVAQAQGPLLATALLSAGWTAAAMASLGTTPPAAGWEEVRRLADAAADSARRHRDRAGLAEALELSGYAAVDQTKAEQMLNEALGIWCETGADVDADRVRLAVAGQVEAQLAAERLAVAGVVPAGADRSSRRLPTVDASIVDAAVRPDPVRLFALGRFAVSVGGRPVPLTAWRSRKARDLLRVLVSRRGRAITRDELSELLWPGEPVERVSHRLSVALSMVRAVLDPRRRASSDYFITGDTGSLALNKDRLTIDAEMFAEYAQFGLGSLRAGRWRDARAALDAADRTYVGDFLDDEPYDHHAAAAREQLRATFLQVTRSLADLARDADEPDDAVRSLLRLLTTDPYDERAYRDLIGVLTESGQHGEARRAQARFVRAMGEIGVEVHDADEVPGHLHAAARPGQA